MATKIENQDLEVAHFNHFKHNICLLYTSDAADE